MASKKFSRLNDILYHLQKCNADLTKIPATTDIAHYLKWKDKDPSSVIHPVQPDRQGLTDVGIIAFGLAKTNDKSKRLVTISGRAAAKLEALSTKDHFNVVKTALETYTDYGKIFVPAKAHVSNVTTASPKTSHITGKPYKAKSSDSWSIPFGQDSADAGLTHQEEVKADIVVAMAGLTGYNISFSPENMKKV